MKFHRVLAMLALAVAPLVSQAFTPESGFYYMYTSDNSAASGGTGLAVDIQNESLFAAGYVYTTTGQPAFVTLQGPLTLQSDGSWSRTDNVFVSTNGQCVDTTAKCPYKKPTVSVTGKFTIKFIAENVGTMTWGATGSEQTVTLIRVAFLAGDHPGSLVGEWDSVFYNGAASSNPQRYSADKIIVQSSTGGSIIGCLAAGETTSGCGSGTQVIPVLGNYTTTTGSLGPITTYQLVVFDSTLTNYQRVYSFSENGFGGQFTGTIKGTVSICGANVTSVANCTAVKDRAFVAYRSASANYAVTGKGMD
jgi:hypothetical protein